MSIAYPSDESQEDTPNLSKSITKTVETIGYRQQNGLEEIERIMADPSTILVDIRLSPRSQNLQWTKTAFSKKYGQRYIWIKQLGNVNHNKDNAPILIADPETGIERLLPLLQDHNLLLMCGCENYESCHRKTVYDLLQDHIPWNNSSAQVLENVLDAKALEATCFSAFYVDDIWEYPDTDLPSKKWCHLATNGSIDDLHNFAQKIGLKREWFQDKPNHPHYDLTPGRRTAAIQNGAIAVDHLELIKICHPKLVEVSAPVANFEDDPTESGAQKKKPAKVSIKELEQQIATLEMKLALATPEEALKAHDQLKKAHIYNRDITYFLREQEHSLAALCRAIDEERPEVLAARELNKRINLFLSNPHHLALNAKEVEATCFSPISLQQEEVRTEPPTELQPFPAGSLQERVFNDLLAERNAEHEENIYFRERDVKALRIIQRQRQREQEARYIRAQIEKIFNCSIQTLLDGPPKVIPIAVHNQLKQELEIIDKLERNPKIKSTQEKFIRHVINASKYGSQRDSEGRTRLNLNKLAEKTGMSPSTAQRGIQFCREQLPSLFDVATYKEKAPTGDETTRYYAAVNQEALQHLERIEPLDFRVQGGDKTICAKCGSKHVRIKKEIVRRVVCDECNHISPPIDDDPLISYEYPNASYTADEAKKTKTVSPSSSSSISNDAIIITSNPPSVCAVENNQDNIPAAAKLLLEIAGPHNQHIEMSRSGEKKYYTVERPLSLSDLEDHLRGGKARGSLCSYPNGQTRSLCWDADDLDPWEILKQAAMLLKEAGYVPLLDESPARGGHLWVIFDAMVDGEAARKQVYQIAPDLKEIKEFWPALASTKNGNRVRLPGAFYYRTGKYAEHEVKAWCRLITAEKSSHDGTSAATLLLASLTPALLIPPIPPDDSPTIIRETELVSQRQPKETVTEMTDRERELGYKLPKVDARWEAGKGNGPVETTTRYFAIMPEYAARWFNERNSLESIQPLECNKMALSPNGNERTASTDYHMTADGERYTDHSQHGMRPDGTKDTGDALELACKIWNKEKWELIRNTCKEIKDKAYAELKSAAHTGKPLPAWLEEPCIITPAGRKHYAFELGKSQNGERGRNPNQLGAGSNSLSEGAGNSARLPKPIGRDDRNTETSHSRAGEGISSSFGGVRGSQQQSSGNGIRELCEQSTGDVRATGNRDNQSQESNNQYQNKQRQFDSDTKRTNRGNQSTQNSSQAAKEGISNPLTAVQGESCLHQDARADAKSATAGDTGVTPSCPDTTETIEGAEGDITEQSIEAAIWRFTEQFVQQDHIKPILVEMGKLKVAEEIERASQFYQQFCKEPGQRLRLNEDDQIVIGVPEDMSDEAFNHIADQVEGYGEALVHVIRERSRKRKIGRCLVVDKGTVCGSTKWIPSKDEQYVCAKCLTPITVTFKIEAARAKAIFHTHENAG